MAQEMTKEKKQAIVSPAPTVTFTPTMFYQFARANQTELKNVAAKQVDIKRLYNIVVHSINKTPGLAKCTVGSIFRGLSEAAQVGLTPNSPLGECYLIPFGNECQMIIGYRGYVALARRTGEIESIQADVIYKGDEYEFEEGLNPIIRWKHKHLTERDEDIIFAVAIARLKGGAYQYALLTRAQIDKIRSRSRAAKAGPWVTDFAEMSKKSAVRRLAKMLPLSVETLNFIERDDKNEFGTIDVPFEPGAATPFDEQKAVEGEVEQAIVDVPAEQNGKTPPSQLPITEGQIAAFRNVAKNKKIDIDEVCQKHYGSTLADITRDQADELSTLVSKMSAP